MWTSAGAERTLRLPAVALTVAALTLAALGGGACVTTKEGEKMQADITELRTRLDDIDKRDKEYKEQVVRLRKVLDEATALLTRNSADVGAKAAKAEQDIAAIQGRIEEMSHAIDTSSKQGNEDRSRLEARVATLEQTQTRIVDKVAPVLPDDKEQLWQQAGQRLATGQRDEGRRFYRVFIQRFPQDPRAPQAYLNVGMSFAQENKYANAVPEFKKILDDYGRSPEVPEAMFQLAVAFVHVGFCSDARAFLGDLVKRYPRSPRAVDARAQLKTIARLPKSACSS